MKNYTSTEDSNDGGESLPRVCFLTETFYPLVGGVQTHTRLLAMHLQSEGVKTLVLTRRADHSFARSEIVDGIPVYRIPPSGMKRFGKYVMIPFAVFELIRRRKDYDVICVCGLRSLGIPAVLASKIIGKTCVLRAEAQGEMSGDYASVYRKLPGIINPAFRLWIKLRNSLLKRADGFVAISSPIEKEFISVGIGHNRVFPIPNGIVTEQYQPVDASTKRALRKKLGLSARDSIIMYSGRLVRGKGVEHLLHTWEKVISSQKDVHLVIVGSGGGISLSCEDELRRFVSDRGLDAAVTFTGFTENVHEYLQAADLFVFPTEYEAFGLSLVEAMACRLPVIATKVGGIPDIIRHLKNGILVEPGDSEALAREITNLLNQPQLAQSLAENARRTACQRYSIKTVSQRYIELFTTLHAAKQMSRSYIRRKEWNIGIAFQPIHEFLNPDNKPEVHWLPPMPSGEFRADPFGIIKDGKTYIFCEEYDYGRRRGIITSLELDGEHSQVVMDMPFHLSYPYLIEHNGEIYCIPESHQAGEIALYKAVEFPHKWEKVSTLISGTAGVDSTVFQYGGRWWLTYTDQDENPYLKLFVRHAPDLFGPWEPHAANPVKTDLGSARPAGTPFMHEGVLYRPAQDCSRIYGGAIVLNRIIKLTPTEFEEEPAVTIPPFADSPYPDGLHTISALGDITLVDGCRVKFIWKAFKSSLTRRLKSAGRSA